MRLGGIEAQVLFSGLHQFLVGLNQLNVIVPASVIPGDQVSIEIEVNGVVSRANVFIAVRPPTAPALVSSP